MDNKAKKIRVILTGGFLGAGKTTSVIRLAGMLQQRGLKVGVITNDQGSRLVDGSFVEANGLTGAEVTGGCFCCRFDDLVREMDALIGKEDPDVLIAEPVGSCTDLVATVFMPLHEQYPDKFILAPYSVAADSILLDALLTGDSFPFSPSIQYLYEKQIEEASILLVNKIDKVDTDEKRRLLEKVKEKYASKVIIPVSALSGEGFEQWIEHLLGGLGQSTGLMPLKEIDYEKYGAAEARLGWYNASISMTGEKLFDPNDLVTDLLEGIAQDVRQKEGTIAHLKAVAQSDGGIIKASVVQGEKFIQFSRSAYDLSHKLHLLVNARVEIEPELLKSIIGEQLRKHCDALALDIRIDHEECFMPSFPNPTYPRKRKCQCGQ